MESQICCIEVRVGGEHSDQCDTDNNERNTKVIYDFKNESNH